MEWGVLATPLFLLPIVVVFLGALVLPTAREWLVSRRRRINLVAMIRADVEERLAVLDRFEREFEELIKRAEAEPDFTPIIADRRGMEGYIDWPAEKWLLSKSQVVRILRFYNNRAAFAEMVKLAAATRFVELPQERKMILYRAILAEARDIKRAGEELLPFLAGGKIGGVAGAVKKQWDRGRSS